MNDLDHETLVKARLEDLLGLAEFIGLSITRVDLTAKDARYCLARAIVQWYKRHPQESLKRRIERRCSRKQNDQ